MSALKNALRKLRDQFRYVRARRGLADYRINTPYIMLGDPKYHTFIGYYDIQPFSADGTKVLGGRCPSSHNGRAMDRPLEIGWFDLESRAFTAIDETPLWCWQQGCRLQWVMWQGKEALLYNTMSDDGEPVSVLYDPQSRSRIAALPLPAYAMDASGRYIASLDFDALERHRPGYGYDWQDKGSGALMGVTLYDTQSGERREILSMADILAVNPHPSMLEGGSVHYINHLHFNPSSSRLMVFHIWDNAGKRRVRALTLDLDGGNIAEVTGGEHVSHYWWLDDERLLFYGTDKERGAGFHIYNQAGGYLAQLTQGMPKGDGHPSLLMSSHGQWLVSDSLPNAQFERDLWLYDMGREKRLDLAHFKSPLKFSGPIRCDLHPRWAADGRYVAVDSAHAGYRQIVLLSVADLAA